MAKPILATDFKDDIKQEAMNGKRRYRMVNNADGTVSFEDATDYEQVGNAYGAGQINATNEAVNQSVDSNKLVKELSTISAITQEGYVPDALAVKELSSSLGEDESGMTVHEKLDEILNGNGLTTKNLQFIDLVHVNQTSSGVVGSTPYTFAGDVNKALFIEFTNASGNTSHETDATLISLYDNEITIGSATYFNPKIYDISNCAGKTITINYSLPAHAAYNALIFKYL